jgi:hypothetical protein
MQELSSTFSFFYKYLLVVIWVLTFGFGCREILFDFSNFDLNWAKYFCSWVGIALCIALVTGPIKRVSLDDQRRQVVISNFRRETRVSIAEVEDVDGSTFLSPRLVWLLLKNPTIFGKKIVFLPASRPARGIGKHPLVQELRSKFDLE